MSGQVTVSEHHNRLRVIDKFLDSVPDAKTLRAMEHVFKELPSTDDIKSTINLTKDIVTVIKTEITSESVKLREDIYSIVNKELGDHHDEDHVWVRMKRGDAEIVRVAGLSSFTKIMINAICVVILTGLISIGTSMLLGGHNVNY